MKGKKKAQRKKKKAESRLLFIYVDVNGKYVDV